MKVKVLATLLCPTFCNSIDCNPWWDSPGKNTGVGCHFPSPGYLPDAGINPRSPALQADSLLSEPLGYKYNDRMSNFTAITSIDRVQTWVNLPNVANADWLQF